MATTHNHKTADVCGFHIAGCGRDTGRDVQMRRNGEQLWGEPDDVYAARKARALALISSRARLREWRLHL